MMTEDGQDWQSVIGYASDGETLMQGQGQSLMTKIREQVPTAFVLKCFCHSFHLVAEHACKTQF